MGIDTLGDAFDAGWRVTAKCEDWHYIEGRLFGSCGTRATLTTETLVWTRGRAFPLRSLAERLRCPRCGSRRVKVLFEPPTEPRAAAVSAR